MNDQRGMAAAAVPHAGSDQLGVMNSLIPDAVAPQRYWGRWVSAVIVLVVVAWVGHSLVANPHIDHQAIGHYMFSAPILDGLRTTIILTVLAEVLSIVLGTGIALCRLSPNPVLSSIAWLYVWLFRGTPLLVQILILGNFSLFYQHLSITLPGGLTLASWSTNSILTMFVASVLALGLHDAAYSSEVVRAGIQSVDGGQLEAARALGVGRALTFRRVVLPQALRVIIPPAGNNFINLLKMTSLVAVIAGGDLLTQAQNVSAANLKTVELLLVASAWYLILVSIFSVAQSAVERRLSRADSRRPAGRSARSALTRLRRNHD
ncbi:MAG TPA: amino acid ABC transporter permease [Flexivirga sp.]|uniref:amino acid ABC transporter permease n=1 Tax=Flexivirga sp. TaxID=1962927 RepID=UPI002C14DEFC|nr:amino acid ABC transporter permease [Flexivirga sp.]HWC21700.1 amino acid ABC transporter permease [Flexivirga sp.]